MGTSSSDFYVVGDHGMIAHYDGSSWRKIESGTDIDIRDIYGTYDPKTVDYEILGVASNVNIDKQIKFFQIKDNEVIDLPLDGLTHFFDGIWFKPNSKYYIVGSGIFENDRRFKTKPWYDYPHGLVSSFHMHDIAANDINDIFTSGSFGEITHFNGETWKNYYHVTQCTCLYNAIDAKDDLVVAVGTDGRTAKVLIGRR